MKTKKNFIGEHIPLIALDDFEQECIEKVMDDYADQETELLNEAVELIRYFVNRVEVGSIRSIETYKKYKDFLNKIE